MVYPGFSRTSSLWVFTHRRQLASPHYNEHHADCIRETISIGVVGISRSLRPAYGQNLACWSRWDRSRRDDQPRGGDAADWALRQLYRHTHLECTGMGLPSCRWRCLYTLGQQIDLWLKQVNDAQTYVVVPCCWRIHSHIGHQQLWCIPFHL